MVSVFFMLFLNLHSKHVQLHKRNLQKEKQFRKAKHTVSGNSLESEIWVPLTHCGALGKSLCLLGFGSSLVKQKA